MSAWSHGTLEHLCRMAAEADALPPRYRLLEVLGAGGMGTVHRAHDEDLGRDVALKVLRAGCGGPDAAQRMLREARIIARLEHPGLVPIHDVGTLPDGRCYYVMKLVRGERLDRFFESAAGLREKLRLLQRVCETVAFAHAHGVIHRDLKPQNIMVGAFGEVLVLDWGVAKVLRDGPMVGTADGTAERARNAGLEPEDAEPTVTRLTAHGTVLGTPAYMAPEQADGDNAQVDERSDVYGLGGILYFCCAGRPPQFENTGGAAELVSPRTFNRELPRRIAAVCVRALARDPAERYASAQEFGEDLANVLDDRPVRAYREGVVERAVRLMGRYRTPILLVLAYLVMRGMLVFWRAA